MFEYREKMASCYAKNSDIGKWPEMTSPVEHSVYKLTLIFLMTKNTV